MKINPTNRSRNRTVVIGAGVAGLSASMLLAHSGDEVILFDSLEAPGGKMRQISSSIGGIDSGPTVFTMKYVFEELFDKVGEDFTSSVKIDKAEILARHAWNQDGIFDLFASREQSTQAINEFFGSENAKGYQKFCTDAGNIFLSLKDTFIGGQRPGPIELGRRIGLLNMSELWQLQPFTTLMKRLRSYFPDPRLQQLFGRYSTYVGSSPYQAPATLALIAHVEQEGVWTIKGGMHALACAMATSAQKAGCKINYGQSVDKILVEGGKVGGVLTSQGNLVPANRVLFCGDVSALARGLVTGTEMLPTAVKPEKRSLSAITWSLESKSNDFPLHRHNVFFSSDYEKEFKSIFVGKEPPTNPTVYVCAQDRCDTPGALTQETERLLCLINAPANGDTHEMTAEETEICERNMTATLNQCGLSLKPTSKTITTPAQFNRMFPGSGGALYGRASHGWMASFARAGSKTKVPGLYLAGGSVHPGPGVPMATRSGMLAAEQMLKDHVST